MVLLQKAAQGLLQLFYPHHCAGCGSDTLPNNQLLCVECREALPETGFAHIAGNTVEKVFYGRLPLQTAAAFLYFTKQALVQHLLHALKYGGNAEMGRYLGRLFGMQLIQSERFRHIDLLVPVPLNAARLKKRGYNQAAVIAEGIGAAMNLPVMANALLRQKPSETQTRKGRTERWQNMQEVFMLNETEMPPGKNILLVDDVITTGATLEACGRELLRAGNLNIGCLAYTI